MVQLSTPCDNPYPGNVPAVRRFLSNYFDLLFSTKSTVLNLTLSPVCFTVVFCELFSGAGDIGLLTVNWQTRSTHPAVSRNYFNVDWNYLSSRTDALCVP